MTTPAAMRLWAVIPAKRFDRGKSRLRAALSETARQRLCGDLLAHVVRTARACGDVAATLVVTDGDDVARLARELGAEVARDPPRKRDLADVVDHGLSEARRRGATHAVVLMADLPQLRAGEIADIAALLRSDDLVLAPDHTTTGTNALGLRLARPFPTCFGARNSLDEHLKQGRAHGLAAVLLGRPGLRSDLDTPEQLKDDDRAEGDEHGAP